MLFAISPAVAQGNARARCIAEAARAGLIGPHLNPRNATFHGGTDGDDVNTFTPTPGRDVFCGFAGNDVIRNFNLETGDIFLGGEGRDELNALEGGMFNGGPGDDLAAVILFGTFNGGPGNDFSVALVQGTYNGGPGDDSASLVIGGGTFNGGDGDDQCSLGGPLGGICNP
jgi:hypothetical protein